MTGTDVASDRRLVVIQRNPTSGSGAGRQEIIRCIRQLRCDGFRVRLFRSRARLDRWLRESVSAEELRCIVSCGGDGTLTDLMNRHPGVALVPFPLGTENLIARYLGIRRDGIQVAEIVRQGRTKRLDAASANDRCFLLMLSAGVDADVVHRVHHARRGHIRRWHYAWPILLGLLRSRSGRVRVESPEDNWTATGGHVIVTNVPVYGFGFSFAPDANPGDGLLDVRIVPFVSRMRILLHAVTLRLIPALAEKDVERHSTRTVRITAVDVDRPVSVQADGDPLPPPPVTVTIQPAMLTVLVPQQVQ